MTTYMSNVVSNKLVTLVSHRRTNRVTKRFGRIYARFSQIYTKNGHFVKDCMKYLLATFMRLVSCLTDSLISCGQTRHMKLYSSYLVAACPFGYMRSTMFVVQSQ